MLLDDLNPAQRDVVMSPSHVLAIACPGSGKTKTLACKAAWLLRKGKCVAAMTFTRDAALELRERIDRLAGREARPRLIVGTFHSSCMLLNQPVRVKSSYGGVILSAIRENGASGESWAVTGEGERHSIIAHALATAGMQLTVDEASALIEAIKAGRKQADQDTPERILIETYRAAMGRNRKIDFQDIILNTVEKLRASAIRPFPVDHLLVDEFQDTDEAQLELTLAHAANGVIVTCVGDDDQSVYGWRRALGFAGMETFVQRVGATRIVLGDNYRSRSEVLAFAGALIAVNRERMPKLLRAAKGPGGHAEWENFGNDEIEADALAAAVRAAADQGNSFAVLSRTNRRLDMVESKLIHQGLDYVRLGGASIFDTPEAAMLGNILGNLVKGAGTLADSLLAWAGVVESDLQILHTLTGSRVEIKRLVNLETKGMSEPGARLYRDYVASYSQWQGIYAAARGACASMLVHGASDFLHRYCPEYRRDALRAVIGVYQPRKPGVTLREHLSALDGVKQIKRCAGTGAVLMTAHGSKGLEFDHVWVIGAQDDSFPDKNAPEEEERRLMYVAMTRARDRLWISCVAKKAPSRFIHEAGIPRAPIGKFATALHGQAPYTAR